MDSLFFHLLLVSSIPWNPLTQSIIRHPDPGSDEDNCRISLCDSSSFFFAGYMNKNPPINPHWILWQGVSLTMISITGRSFILCLCIPQKLIRETGIKSLQNRGKHESNDSLSHRFRSSRTSVEWYSTIPGGLVHSSLHRSFLLQLRTTAWRRWGQTIPREMKDN
jgi:hypothetical protein